MEDITDDLMDWKIFSMQGQPTYVFSKKKVLEE